MSVGEEITECPLCMEMLEMDDINFFPCTCGYQICRFCWHRIRTDENGLCPACRKQYPEDPAQFKPLTDDELSRIKKERRHKDLQRKQKAAENRKHLANVRVVQRNLVFVVGLSQRLADPEVLKKNEYFGKFGKIHKVVINHSTSYAGAQSSSQGPSASAYVTYQRPEDTLRAIQAVNNIHVDGRTLKASLGTTKYCSHFLRGSQCPKPDCMYLHELGEESASFTKDEMQQGKHQEYEQRLYEQYMNSQNITNNQTLSTSQILKSQTRKKTGSPDNLDGGSQSSDLFETPEGTPPTSSDTWPSSSSSTPPPNSSCREAWPSLQVSGSPSSASPEPSVMSNASSVIGRSGSDHMLNGNKSHTENSSSKQDRQNAQNRAPGHHRNSTQSSNSHTESNQIHSNGLSSPNSGSTNSQATCIGKSNTGVPLQPHQQQHKHIAASLASRSLYNTNDSMSLFSSGTGFTSSRNKPTVSTNHMPDTVSTAEIPDTIPVASSTDWQAAFGFTPSLVAAPQSISENHDDDLGFDPWNESSKALADLIEKEDNSLHNRGFLPPGGLNHTLGAPPGLEHKPLPPGITPNHIHDAFHSALPQTAGNFMGTSKLMGLVTMQQQQQQQQSGLLGPVSNTQMPNAQHPYHQHSLSDLTKKDQNSDVYNMKDWQDGLRALLPTVNIHFGTPPHGSSNFPTSQNKPSIPHIGEQMPGREWLGNDISRLPTAVPPPPPPQQQQQQHHHHQPLSDLSGWDPAIVTQVSATLTDFDSLTNFAPLPNADLQAYTTSNPGVDEQTPHWMASLQNLTDEASQHHTQMDSHSRLPFVQQFPSYNSGVNWSSAQAQHPPPGFRTSQMRSHSQQHPNTSNERVQQLEAGVQ